MLVSIFQYLSGSDLEVCYYVNYHWGSIIKRTKSLWVGDPIQKAIGQGKSYSLSDPEWIECHLFCRYLRVASIMNQPSHNYVPFRIKDQISRLWVSSAGQMSHCHCLEPSTHCLGSFSPFRYRFRRKTYLFILSRHSNFGKISPQFLRMGVLDPETTPRSKVYGIHIYLYIFIYIYIYNV